MIAFLVTHWGLICAVFGSTAFASAVSTVVNLYADPDHNPETPPPGWVVPFIVLKNLLALRAGDGRKGIDGIGDGMWTVPLFHYPKVGDPVPAKNGAAPRAIAWFLVPALLLNGCIYGKCLLGKLPSSAQPILVDATQALTGQNWEASLASIAATVGADALDCAVQAIVAARQQAQDAQFKVMADSAVRMAPPVDFVLEHGRAWLAKHPAKACGEIAPEIRSAVSLLGLSCTESRGIREVTCQDLLGNEVSFQGTLRLAAAQ